MATQRERGVSESPRFSEESSQLVLYTPHNAFGASVIDMYSSAAIKTVLEINDKAGWVKVAHNPVRLDLNGKNIVGERIRFRSIYPIFGRSTRPVLFHCYGRQG